MGSTGAERLAELLRATKRRHRVLETHPVRGLSPDLRILYLRVLSLGAAGEEGLGEGGREYLEALLSTFEIPLERRGEEMERIRRFASAPDQETLDEFVTAFRGTPEAPVFLLDYREMAPNPEETQEDREPLFSLWADLLGLSEATAASLRGSSP